ncbi:hypothetical protein EON65_27750 [archaeon]|nr:MAG: hypothetical protein EON65_27750 [archaeon]
MQLSFRTITIDTKLVKSLLTLTKTNSSENCIITWTEIYRVMSQEEHNIPWLGTDVKNEWGLLV